MNSNDYGAVAKWLHWVLAGLISAEYLIGLTLDNTHWKPFHIQLGMIILILVVIRIAWRLSHHYPKMDIRLSRNNQRLAHWGHISLYLLMMIIPMTGLVYLFTKGVTVNLLGFDIAPLMEGLDKSTRRPIKIIHLYAAHLIIALAVGHAISAVFHQHFHKIAILDRMLTSKK